MSLTDLLSEARPPEVWRNIKLLTEPMKAWCQSVADHHYAHGYDEEDAELSTRAFPICAAPESVRPHIDQFDGAELGKRIYGLVIRSDRHILHSRLLARTIPEGIMLQEGDVYALDPHDRHWTVAPTGGQLIFAATFLPLTDPRSGNPKQIAHDLFWDTLKAMTDDEAAQAKAVAEEKARYHGIEPLGQQRVADLGLDRI